MIRPSKVMKKKLCSLAAAAIATVGVGTATFAGESTASAQEIQLTGPLAGAPAVRKLRLYRPGRVELALGPGFTLLDFGAPESAAALAVAAAVRHVPLKTLALPPLEPYRAKLVLVRPDQHVAWHGDGVADAGAVIDVARGETSAQSAP